MTSLFNRLARFITVARFVILQTIQRNIISIKRSRLFSPTTQPNAWKDITGKPYLYPSRVFRPKIKDASSVPLIIMVHGGGWIMNNPSADDPLARFLADTCDYIVVSIDYRKAPRHSFPAGYEDVVESTLALLGDEADDLPIDRNKVALCGSSAGGNLVLSAAQDSRLRGKLLGVVAIYPAVDFGPTAAERMATRPIPSIPDFIGDSWDEVSSIYVGDTSKVDLRDPRLSPTNFETRECLPKHLLFLGCEHDMFCHEAKVMAQKLIDADASPKDQTAGTRPVRGVSWMLVEGQKHAFDHFPEKAQEAEKTRLRVKDAMYQDIAQWLRDALGTISTNE